jgi:hypothetical protein
MGRKRWQVTIEVTMEIEEESYIDAEIEAFNLLRDAIAENTVAEVTDFGVTDSRLIEEERQHENLHDNTEV